MRAVRNRCTEGGRKADMECPQHCNCEVLVHRKKGVYRILAWNPTFPLVLGPAPRCARCCAEKCEDKNYLHERPDPKPDQPPVRSFSAPSSLAVPSGFTRAFGAVTRSGVQCGCRARVRSAKGQWLPSAGDALRQGYPSASAGL